MDGLVGNRVTVAVGDDRRAELRAAYLKLNDLSLALDAAVVSAAGPGVLGNAEVLALLRLREAPARPRELIDVTGLTSAGVSNLLDRLEQGVLVSRTHGAPGDGRAVVVDGTPQGRELIESVLDSVCTVFESLRSLRRDLLGLIGAPVPSLRSMSVACDEVIGRLAQLGSELTEAVRLDDFPDDPSPTRTAVVLTAAARDGGVRPRELRTMTTLSAGGVSQLLDRLEHVGLVTRVTGRPPDRRSVTVRLTRSGENACERCMDQLAEHAAAIATALT